MWATTASVRGARTWPSRFAEARAEGTTTTALLHEEALPGNSSSDKAGGLDVRKHKTPLGSKATQAQAVEAVHDEIAPAAGHYSSAWHSTWVLARAQCLDGRFHPWWARTR